jgi:hypothetical protein
MPVVTSQHLLNVFVQLANKRGFKKKSHNVMWSRAYGYSRVDCRQDTVGTGLFSLISADSTVLELAHSC